MLPILESRILELYDQRVDNEKQKKIAHHILKEINERFKRDLREI